MKNDKSKMTIKEILTAFFNGNTENAEKVIEQGSIDFGCNPNWKYPNMIWAYRIPESVISKTLGRCISRTSYSATDGETAISVSYESDSSD